MKADRKMIKKAIVCAFEELLGFSPALSSIAFVSNWGEQFDVLSKGAAHLYKFCFEPLDGDIHSCHLILYRSVCGTWQTVGKSHSLWDFFHSGDLHND